MAVIAVLDFDWDDLQMYLLWNLHAGLGVISAVEVH